MGCREKGCKSICTLRDVTVLDVEKIGGNLHVDISPKMNID